MKFLLGRKPKNHAMKNKKPPTMKNVASTSSSLLFLHTHKDMKKKNKVKVEEQDNINNNNNNNIIIVGQPPVYYCGICFEYKAESQMFRTSQCHHPFCYDCIFNYVASQIQNNTVLNVNCPNPNCIMELTPENLRPILANEVIVQWESSNCELSIAEWQKTYCPYTDCSVLLVNDGDGKVVTSAECPSCHRLFCAQCKVPWHADMNCKKFQKLKRNGERDLDNKFFMLVKKEVWNRCPKCNIHVERLHGCEHIMCRCGCNFCYNCGKEWRFGHVCSRRPLKEWMLHIANAMGLVATAGILIIVGWDFCFSFLNYSKPVHLAVFDEIDQKQKRVFDEEPKPQHVDVHNEDILKPASSSFRLPFYNPISLILKTIAEMCYDNSRDRDNSNLKDLLPKIKCPRPNFVSVFRLSLSGGSLVCNCYPTQKFLLNESTSRM